MSEDEDFQGFDEPVVIPIEESIDLHYFPPRDVGDIVDAYLEAARERGFREVRIIHGRGKGVQRHRVHRHLARSPHVVAFEEAPADRGGWGATLARLHPPEAPAPGGGDPDEPEAN
ncbi:MAG: Smr/MutS family protein [Myxococcota bacterium]